MKKIFHLSTPILLFLLMNQMAWGQGQLLDTSLIQRASFGNHVAIDGNYAVVTGGIARHPTLNSDVSVLSVYQFDGTEWGYHQTLFSEDAFSYNKLDGQIDIGNSRIVAGAPSVGSGAVVYFTQMGTDWVEQGQLFHSSTTAGFGAIFGSYVKQFNDVLVVADTRERAESGNLPFLPQSIYIFRNNGSEWIADDTLSVSTGDLGTSFGSSTATHEDIIVVGDPLFSAGTNVTREGAAYVYDYNGTSWELSQRLEAGPYADANDRLGTSVATDGNTIVVGAVRDTVGTVVSAGAAYVFRKQNDDWELAQRLVASDGMQQDYFGQTLALEGDHLIVGAPNDFRPNFVNAGGYAYYFRFNGTEWTEEAKLILPNAVSDDRFGWSVDISGNWVIIGAPGRTPITTFRGEAYIYDLTNLTSTASEPLQPHYILDAGLHPNPFLHAPTISFTLNQPGYLKLDVYDVLGRHVDRLLEGYMTNGQHNEQWDNKNLPPGVYFFRLTTETSSHVLKGILRTD